MHRFCKLCIEACLRKTNLECPVCRKHLRSKRSFCPDPAFDRLLAALYGDVAAFNAREGAFLGAVSLASFRDSAEGQRQAQLLESQQEAQKLKKRGRPPGSGAGAPPPPKRAGAGAGAGARGGKRSGAGRAAEERGADAWLAAVAQANAAAARVEEKYRAKRLHLQVKYHEDMKRFRRFLTGEGERGRAVEVRVNGSLGEVALLAAPEAAAAELAEAVRALLPLPPEGARGGGAWSSCCRVAGGGWGRGLRWGACGGEGPRRACACFTRPREGGGGRTNLRNSVLL